MPNISFISPGQIWKVRDSGRYTHNYIVLGQSKKILSNVQVMCITSMKDKHVTTEVPILLDDMVGYILPQNIHSMKYNDFIEKFECIGQMSDTRYISVSAFVDLLVGMWEYLNIPWCPEERCNEVLHKFDDYCEAFQRANKGVMEYREVRYNTSGTQRSYRYEQPREVQVMLDNEDSAANILPIHPIMDDFYDPVEMGDVTVPKQKTKTQLKKERAAARAEEKEKRKKERREVELGITDRDREDLYLIERDAPGGDLSEWEDEVLKDLMVSLGQKYGPRILHRVSKRWPTESAIRNILAQCNGGRPVAKKCKNYRKTPVKKTERASYKSKTSVISGDDMMTWKELDNAPIKYADWSVDQLETFKLIVTCYKYATLADNSKRWRDSTAISHTLNRIEYELEKRGKV